MVSAYLHTLGDSVLDNIFWVSSPEKSVEGILANLVETNQKVVSSAYDGFTTRSVLEGGLIGRVLPMGGGKKQQYLKYKTESGQEEQVKPLQKIAKLVAENPDTPHYIAISVAGNDFREQLGNPWQLIKSISAVQKRYLEILTRLKGLAARNVYPIVVLLYRTDAKNDAYGIYRVFKQVGTIALRVQQASFSIIAVSAALAAATQPTFYAGAVLALGIAGLALSHTVLPLTAMKDLYSGEKVEMIVFKHLLHSFYQPILAKAKQENIPVLDLANTFDPKKELYTSGIEPNEVGGRLIAEGIQHVVKSHDFTKESAIYAKRPGESSFEGVPNQPSSWYVK